MSEKLDNKVDDDYWRDQWKNNDIDWHMNRVNQRLMNHADKLLFKSGISRKVFVPLCGKTLDMKWLYDKGCRVVGVDCADDALEEFMKEQGIAYMRKEVNGTPVIESEDKRIILWGCNLFDFFDINTEKDFDAIWDRGSFVAINFSEREKYVKLMHSILAPDFRYLLEWYCYDGRLFGGPPKTSSEEEIEQLYGPFFKNEVVEKRPFNMKGFGIEEEQVMYVTLFTPKNN